MPPDASGWVIVGATSPIARAFAALIARECSSVLLAGRRPEMLARDAADLSIRYQVQSAPLAFDITNLSGHAAFAEACRRRIAGTMNVFVAAGAMPPQEAIEKDYRLLEASLAANLVGVAALLLAFAPHLEHQRSGSLVVLGSVAGDRGRPKNYVYGAGKAGLHVFLQGLRARLFRHGAHVLTVKPGFVDTSMTFGMPGLFLVASPEDCAEACLAAVHRRTEIIYTPHFWWPLMLAIKAVPERIFKRLNF